MVYGRALVAQWSERCSPDELLLVGRGVVNRLMLIAGAVGGAVPFVGICIGAVMVPHGLALFGMQSLVLLFGRSTAERKDGAYLMSGRVMLSLGIWGIFFWLVRYVMLMLSFVAAYADGSLLSGCMVLWGLYLFDVPAYTVAMIIRSFYKALAAWVSYLPFFIIAMLFWYITAWALHGVMQAYIGLVQGTLLSVDTVSIGMIRGVTLLVDLLYAVTILVCYESIRYYEEYVW